MTIAPHLDPAREPASDTEQKQIALSYLLEAWSEARHAGLAVQRTLRARHHLRRGCDRQICRRTPRAHPEWRIFRAHLAPVASGCSNRPTLEPPAFAP